MKVEYDIKNNYIKYYNEANGIVALKEKLKKNPNKKVRGYLSYITLNFLVYFIIYFIMCKSRNSFKICIIFDF